MRIQSEPAPGIRSTGYLGEETSPEGPARVHPGDAPSDASFPMLFRSNPLPMWICDLETLQFLDVNDAAVEAYGYTRDEFLDMRITDIRPPDERPRLLRTLQERRAVLEHSGTWRHLRKDGRMLDVEVTSHLLQFSGRRASLVLARDITERKQAEGALQASEERYRALTELASDLAYAIKVGDDQSLEVEWISDAYYQRLGISAYRVDLPSLLALIHLEDRPSVEAALDRALAGEGASLEFRLVGPTGEERWVSFVYRGALDETLGRVVRIYGAGRDITQRKRAERDLRLALEKEREAAERLRALDEMKNAFLNAVSHELRTPLAVVLGSALTLERIGLDLGAADQQDMLRAITANAKKLQRMLTDLLDLDRLTRGVLKLHLAQTELGSLVRGVVKDTDFLGDRPIDVQADSMVLPVDAPKVERIVENLVANALKYSPSGSPIRVVVHRVPEGALISVEDQGPGVPEELRQTIFEPFRQGPSAPLHSPGVGIGLSLVARFAELHGGSAWVEEREGGGSAFRVLLREPSAPRYEQD